MFYRSSYEKRYLEILEEEETVSSFETEPFRLPYMFEGSMKNYVPDVLVTKTDGKQYLVEVKPQYLTDNSQVLAKASAARVWCESNGVEYVIITESDLVTLGEVQK
jgi:DNA-directed RNA polymerase specialized sigma54-like protein